MSHPWLPPLKHPGTGSRFNTSCPPPRIFIKSSTTAPLPTDIVEISGFLHKKLSSYYATYRDTIHPSRRKRPWKIFWHSLIGMPRKTIPALRSGASTILPHFLQASALFITTLQIQDKQMAFANNPAKSDPKALNIPPVLSSRMKFTSQDKYTAGTVPWSTNLD